MVVTTPTGTSPAAVNTGNTLARPPRLSGDATKDNLMLLRWFNDFWDQFANVNNVIGTQQNFAERIANLEKGVPAANPVTTVYTANGAIAATDGLALLDAGTALTMTLGTGTSDGHVLTVKRFGAGHATITGTIDGTTGLTVRMSSNSLFEAVTFTWFAGGSTWLLS